MLAEKCQMPRLQPATKVYRILGLRNSKSTLILALALSVLWTVAKAQSEDASAVYFYPRVEFGDGWQADVVVVNTAKDPRSVRLVGYDASGTLVGEIPGPALDPGEWRVYSQADGTWPVGASSLKVEASGAIQSFVTLRSSDGSALEIIPPSSEPAKRLALPVLQEEEVWWASLALVNAGSAPTELRAIASDEDGRLLDEASPGELAPVQGLTTSLSDLFDPVVAEATHTLTVTADQPAAAQYVFGTQGRKDVAALSAPLSASRQLYLPIFQSAQNGTIWTMAGLLNPKDSAAHLTAEAFDAENRSLAAWPI